MPGERLDGDEPIIIFGLDESLYRLK